MSEFERYEPINPLPEEIQNLSPDETVCKFCGVSYLIHSEMKKLQEQLETTLKQLQDYNRMKGAFDNLEKKNIKYVENEAKYNNQIVALNENIIKLEESLSKSKQENDTLQNENINIKQTCHSQANTLKYDTEKIRNLEKLTNFYPPLMKQIRILKDYHRQNIEDFKSLMDYQAELKSLSTFVNEMSQKAMYLNNKVTTVSDDNVSLQNELSQCREENSKLMGDIKILERSSSSLAHTQEQNVQLSKLMAQTQREVEQLKNRLVKCEDTRLNLEHAVASKTQENNELKSHLNSQTKRYTKQIEDLNSKYTSSIEIQNSLKQKISSHVDEFQKEKEKENSKQKDLEVCNAEMSNRLELLSKENTAIHDKTRIMSETHRLQLADLHSSYQQQLKDALRHKQDHAADMESLQRELNKQECVYRDTMRETKARYDKEIQNITRSNKEVHVNLEKQIETLSQQYSSDLRSKETAIREIEKSFALQTSSLQSENDTFRRTISQLNEQINVYEQTIKQLECSPTDSHQLKELKSRNKELEGEVLTLQRIVQRECEERYELSAKIQQLQSSRESSDVSAKQQLRSSTGRESSDISAKNSNLLKSRNKVERHSRGVSHRGGSNRRF